MGNINNAMEKQNYINFLTKKFDGLKSHDGAVGVLEVMSAVQESRIPIRLEDIAVLYVLQGEVKQVGRYTLGQILNLAEICIADQMKEQDTNANAACQSIFAKFLVSKTAAVEEVTSWLRELIIVVAAAFKDKRGDIENVEVNKIGDVDDASQADAVVLSDDTLKTGEANHLNSNRKEKVLGGEKIYIGEKTMGFVHALLTHDAQREKDCTKSELIKLLVQQGKHDDGDTPNGYTSIDIMMELFDAYLASVYDTIVHSLGISSADFL